MPADSCGGRQTRQLARFIAITYTVRILQKAYWKGTVGVALSVRVRWDWGGGGVGGCVWGGGGVGWLVLGSVGGWWGW